MQKRISSQPNFINFFGTPTIECKGFDLDLEVKGVLYKVPYKGVLKEEDFILWDHVTSILADGVDVTALYDANVDFMGEIFQLMDAKKLFATGKSAHFKIDNQSPVKPHGIRMVYGLETSEYGFVQAGYTLYCSNPTEPHTSNYNCQTMPIVSSLLVGNIDVLHPDSYDAEVVLDLLPHFIDEMTSGLSDKLYQSATCVESFTSFNKSKAA